MKEINIAFDLVQKRFPSWGDYVCLCEVVKRNKYSNFNIRKAFLKLVSRNEYDIKEKEEYIKYLFSINKKYE